MLENIASQHWRPLLALDTVDTGETVERRGGSWGYYCSLFRTRPATGDDIEEERLVRSLEDDFRDSEDNWFNY